MLCDQRPHVGYCEGRIGNAWYLDAAVGTAARPEHSAPGRMPRRRALGGCSDSNRYTGRIGDEMHDVFIVISEGTGGEHIARTIYAASEHDARQTHQENYVGEPIVAVDQ